MVTPAISDECNRPNSKTGAFGQQIRHYDILPVMTTAQKTEIKKAVNAALREIFSDPDYGFELTSAFKRKLSTARKEVAQGKALNLRTLLRKNR